MNVLRCQIMKRGYECLGFQPISVIMIDSNQLNFFLMSCSSINQKGMHDYLNIPKWHIFICSAKTLLKKSNNVLFSHPHLLYFIPNLWNVNLIKNLIWLSLSTHMFYGKIQDSSINSTKFGDLPYKNIMPSYKTYFILFLVKIWSNLNKYC
jgi:hypothetical protein